MTKDTLPVPSESLPCPECEKPLNWDRPAGGVWTQCSTCGRHSINEDTGQGPTQELHFRDTLPMAEGTAAPAPVPVPPSDPFAPIEVVVRYWKTELEKKPPALTNIHVAFEQILSTIEEARTWAKDKEGEA